MMVLVTYDVNTEDEIGKKRLRLVAKVCRITDSGFQTQFLSAWFVQLNGSI